MPDHFCSGSSLLFFLASLYLLRLYFSYFLLLLTQELLLHTQSSFSRLTSLPSATMGIAGLHDLTKPIQNSVHLSEFEGQTVGIDANGWLHKAVFGFDFDPNMDAFVNA